MRHESRTAENCARVISRIVYETHFSRESCGGYGAGFASMHPHIRDTDALIRHALAVLLPAAGPACTSLATMEPLMLRALPFYTDAHLEQVMRALGGEPGPAIAQQELLRPAPMVMRRPPLARKLSTPPATPKEPEPAEPGEAAPKEKPVQPGEEAPKDLFMRPFCVYVDSAGNRYTTDANAEVADAGDAQFRFLRSRGGSVCEMAVLTPLRVPLKRVSGKLYGALPLESLPHESSRSLLGFELPAKERAGCGEVVLAIGGGSGGDAKTFRLRPRPTRDGGLLFRVPATARLRTGLHLRVRVSPGCGEAETPLSGLQLRTIQEDTLCECWRQA